MEERISTNTTRVSKSEGRTSSSVIWFWLFTICTAGIPLINLTPFFFQYTTFSAVVDLNTATLAPVVENKYFDIYYILMGCYVFIIIVSFYYASQFTTLWKRIKLFLLLDSIVIAEIITSVKYVVIYLIYFCKAYP
jgi:hypothetical protein